MAETLPIPCPRRQGADERHCSDNAVTLREPRSVSLRPGSPRRSVDPTSGYRAQLSMRTSLVIGLAVLAACGGGVQPPELIPAGPGGPLPTAPAAPGAAPGPGPTTSAPAHRALIAADWALAGRAQAVTGSQAMVVSSHPVASEVGTDILRRGGNAVDAAVAVGFALAVVHPVAGNIGGGGFMVIRMRDGRVRALDYRETAPRRASHDMYVDSAGNVTAASLTGHLSVGVPGSVAGMFEAHRKFGKLPWRELLAPAIRLAREGYELDFPRSRQIGLAAERLGRFPASATQFLVKGQEAPPGTRFVQPELARTPQLIADSGPRVFYRAYIDRNRYLGDPDFVDMPLERLLSKSYAGELRAAIDAQRATPTPPSAGVRSEGTETTHYSIVDTEGDAVSCTTTLNNDFGSAVTVTGAGFLLNDEMDDFTSAPGKPNLFGLIQGEANAIAPGKRMLSAMTPSLVLDRAGRLALVLGSPGGSRIPTAVYQVISDVIDQDMPLPDAVAAPRLHHQALPDELYLERGGFVRPSVDSLEAMGHKVSVWGYKTEVNAIARTAAGWVGVADPRRGGGAAGY